MSIKLYTTAMAGGVEAGRGQAGERPGEVRFMGPVILVPGQNFYNQPPFIGEIGRVVGSSRMNPVRFTTAVSHLVQPGVSEYPQTLAARVKGARNHTAVRLLFSGNPGNARECDMLIDLLRGLSGFSHWEEYIKAKMDHYIYRPSGQHHESAKLRKYPPSFFAWAEELQRRTGVLDRGASIEAIGDVFPQQLRGAKLGEVLPQGKRTVHRVWVFRKAGEVG